MGWAIIVGFAITAVIALALRKVVEGPLRSLWVVAIGLIGWSVVMFIADRIAARRDVGARAVGSGTRDEASTTWVDGAILGLVQAISLIPWRLPLRRNDLRGVVPWLRPGQRDPDELLPPASRRSSRPVGSRRSARPVTSPAGRAGSRPESGRSSPASSRTSRSPGC